MTAGLTSLFCVYSFPQIVNYIVYRKITDMLFVYILELLGNAVKQLGKVKEKCAVIQRLRIARIWCTRHFCQIFDKYSASYSNICCCLFISYRVVHSKANVQTMKDAFCLVLRYILFDVCCIGLFIQILQACQSPDVQLRWVQLVLLKVKWLLGLSILNIFIILKRKSLSLKNVKTNLIRFLSKDESCSANPRA